MWDYKYIYLDFTKAFDSVSHNELLLKLWSMGITSNLWKWCECYLTNHIQRVSVNNYLSTPLPVISGVPLGSILGPLLFLIYINDLPPAVTSSKVLLFADDAKCYKTIHNLSDIHLLQLDLDSLTNWSHTNHLFFKVIQSDLNQFLEYLKVIPIVLMVAKFLKKFLIAIWVLLFLQTYHGTVIMSLLLAKPIKSLVFFGVLSNVQIQF